jgi:hypothetical protein
MIKVAQAAAADSRLRFATGTAERLPLDEGTFDSSSAPPPSITGRISKRLVSCAGNPLKISCQGVDRTGQPSVSPEHPITLNYMALGAAGLPVKAGQLPKFSRQSGVTQRHGRLICHWSRSPGTA